MRGGDVDYQHTVARSATISGIALHTGVPVSLHLKTAPANTGIVFKRTDLEGFPIEARARNVARVSYATSLMKKGVLISTTEHLLSALAASQVDNVLVEIDNLEVPIMDGSALPFFRLIAQAGLKRQRAPRTYAKVRRSLEVIESGKRIAIHPSDGFRITYRIGFPHPLIGEQCFSFWPAGTASANGIPASRNYETDIAPARTFGMLEEVEVLRKQGLVRGGSLESAIVLTRDGVLNPEGLRFPDEFCRHKILDLIGDLVMLGYPLLGHVVAERAGHAMHYALVSRMLREKDAWELVNADAGRPATVSPAAEAGEREGLDLNSRHRAAHAR